MRTTRIFFCVETAMLRGAGAAAPVRRNSDRNRGIMPPPTAASVLSLERLHGLALGLVDAEHRQEIRELQRAADAVLRLEEDELRAEALRGFEALNQLAEAVAVDVIHLREIEEDLLVARVEQLRHEARQHLVADADRQPSLKVDDDHVTF